MNSLSLYVHIPWCEKKCPYCDFNSHTSPKALDESSYTQALLDDLAADLAHYQLQDRQLQSIFIGGGTPSLFSALSISNLIAGIKSQIEFADDFEITLEANPSSAEAAKFSGFKDAGVNRLSIGVQSFNDQHLKSLGRVHNSQQALNAAQAAIEAGLNNFNIDIMFGLPKQTLSESLADLEQAIALKPRHLSCYQLTIEPNTYFHARPPVRPDDEQLWQMQRQVHSTLKAAGYQQYEVSAYAFDDAHNCSRHNLNYWQFGDYLGIGAGAHGKITQTNKQISRYWKVKHPTAYLDKIQTTKQAIGGRDFVAETDIVFEFMLNALRLTNGFELKLFEQQTLLSRDSILPTLEQHQQQGLLDYNQHSVTLSDRGRMVIDTMLQDYLPSQN